MYIVKIVNFYKNLILVQPILNCYLYLFQKTIYGANVVIFEGIMSFVNKDLLNVGTSFIASILQIQNDIARQQKID